MKIATWLGCLAVLSGGRLGDGFKFQGSTLDSLPSYSEVVVLTHLTVEDSSPPNDDPLTFVPLLKYKEGEGEVSWILGRMTSKKSPLIAISKPKKMTTVTEVPKRQDFKDLISLLNYATGSYVLGCQESWWGGVDQVVHQQLRGVPVKFESFEHWRNILNQQRLKASGGGMKENQGAYAIGASSLGLLGSKDQVDKKVMEKKRLYFNLVGGWHYDQGVNDKNIENVGNLENLYWVGRLQKIHFTSGAGFTTFGGRMEGFWMTYLKIDQFAAFAVDRSRFHFESERYEKTADVDQKMSREIKWCITRLSRASLTGDLSEEEKQQGEGFLAVLCLRYLGAAAADAYFKREDIEGHVTFDSLNNQREAFFSRLIRFDEAFDGSNLHALTTLANLWRELPDRVQEQLHSFQEVDGIGPWPEVQSGSLSDLKDMHCRHVFSLIYMNGKRYSEKLGGAEAVRGEAQQVLKGKYNAVNMDEICNPPKKHKWEDHESFEIRFYDDDKNVNKMEVDQSKVQLFGKGLETLGLQFGRTGFDFVSLESMDGKSYNRDTKFNGENRKGT